MANSGWKGTPILRTRMRSSGTSSAVATHAATGTPARGSARITGCRSLYPASAAANFYPASDRFLKGIKLSLLASRARGAGAVSWFGAKITFEPLSREVDYRFQCSGLGKEVARVRNDL